MVVGVGVGSWRGIEERDTTRRRCWIDMVSGVGGKERKHHDRYLCVPRSYLPLSAEPARAAAWKVPKVVPRLLGAAGEVDLGGEVWGLGSTVHFSTCLGKAAGGDGGGRNRRVVVAWKEWE